MKNKELPRVIITKELVEGDHCYFGDVYLVHLSIKISYKNFFGKKCFRYRKVYTVNENDLNRLEVYSADGIKKALVNIYLKKRRGLRMSRVIKNLPC